LFWNARAWVGNDNNNQTGNLDCMNAHPRPAIVRSVAAEAQPACAACQAHELNWCQAASAAQGNPAQTEPVQIAQSSHTVPARRIICREQDLHDAVPIICTGWAASVVTLSDGSRQILTFLLPGDLVSTALLFAPRSHCLVEAITEVRFRTFNRSELKAALFKHPDLFDKLSKSWIEEKNQADQLIIDLGRRTADERIARLILSLAERLAKRGMTAHADSMAAMEMDFPLRQHHIADATGLTPVHVSKVLSEFRRRGLIKISDRTLAILDPAGFRRIAHTR
jgi:CRP/FNR family transcriptional regulator, anaerobic regulatory protein